MVLSTNPLADPLSIIGTDDAAGCMSEPRLITESGLEARVAAIAEPVCEGFGFRLVRVRISGRDGLTVQVMIDKADGEVTVDDCADVSRDLSAIFDVEDPLDRAYHLEVSSPGIDRVLVRASDFERWTGHEAKIEMSRLIDGRRRFRGVIEGYADGIVSVGMNGEAGPETTGLPVADMAEAKLVMNDALLRTSLKAGKQALKA